MFYNLFDRSVKSKSKLFIKTQIVLTDQTDFKVGIKTDTTISFSDHQDTNCRGLLIYVVFKCSALYILEFSTKMNVSDK